MIGDIVKDSLAYQIYDDLRHDILTHKIGFGAKLTNRELQEKYQVSSTPVRDAINRLYLDGFVTEITRAGAKVVDFNLRFALEINEITSMLSQSALRYASLRSNRDDVAEILCRKIALEEKHINGEKYYQYDAEFHETFFQYADNDRLMSLYRRYADMQEMLTRYIYQAEGNSKQTAIEQHRGICEAFRDGNIAEAQQLMEQHYLWAESAVRKGFSGDR